MKYRDETMFHVNSVGMNNESCEWCRECNSPQISKCQLECMSSKRIFLLYSGPPHNIIDISQDHGTDAYG